jgi:hypothetical protein
VGCPATKLYTNIGGDAESAPIISEKRNLHGPPDVIARRVNIPLPHKSTQVLGNEADKNLSTVAGSALSLCYPENKVAAVL